MSGSKPTENADDREYEVDIPLSVPRDTAREILNDLEGGVSVTFELQPENCRNIVEQIEWQLEHGRPVTELADAYTEGEA